MSSKKEIKRAAEPDEQEVLVERWKVKKLVDSLTKARGNGTSMISLILPPGDQISRVNKLLTTEYGTATNIKSRVNRSSVLSAITSAQYLVKQRGKIPANGLVIFVGNVITAEGKERKLAVDFEPFKPISTSLYYCGSKFRTEPLLELLESDEKFGFIVMDGHGTLFGEVSGRSRTILHKFTVDLPKKHGRGGQSAARFGRLRLEKRRNYIRKVSELATQLFCPKDTPNISGLILAGAAEFKAKLAESDLFDPRLQAVVLRLVDVSYGGENGFNQAIELSADALTDLKFVREKKLLSKYYDEIARDTGRYCYGVRDTLIALDAGAVSDLIVYEDLSIQRYKLYDPTAQKDIIKHLRAEERKDVTNFQNKEGVDYEIREEQPLLEWITENYKTFGCNLHFVTDKSPEGSQFLKGFGGIGGLMRWTLSFEDHLDEDEIPSDDDDDDADADGFDSDFDDDFL